jgi:FkbM family methyltransferase
MNIRKKIRELPKVLSLYRNPLVYYLDKLQMLGNRSNLITLKLGRDLKLKIHAGNSDINSIDEIFLMDVYEKMLSNIELGSSVVDIGANIGVFTAAAASRLTTGKVFSFEPNPEIFGLLNENIVLNNFGNKVVTYPMAVTSKRENRSLYFESQMWGGAHVVGENPAKEQAEKFEVECIGLDDIFELTQLTSIDFLKIDVEGAEEEILKGATPDAFNRIRHILIEHHAPLVSPAEIKKILENNDFNVIESRDFEAYYATNKKFSVDVATQPYY